MKVTILEHTPNPEQLVATAAKLCYSSSDIEGLREKQSPEKVKAFIDRLSNMGHQSPLEHITFTFAIEGISRAVLAQITRHRIASYSVKSQRYVTENEPCYITPIEIEKNEEANQLYQSMMGCIWSTYRYISEFLKESYIKQGMNPKDAQKKAIENARYILPNACETKMIVTMNARSLLNYFSERCCNRCQDEHRALADEMLRQVKEICPTIFANAGAPCVRGKCPEGAMSCGKPRNKENSADE